jgi:hypothetical protein
MNPQHDRLASPACNSNVEGPEICGDETLIVDARAGQSFSRPVEDTLTAWHRRQAGRCRDGGGPIARPKETL